MKQATARQLARNGIVGTKDEVSGEFPCGFELALDGYAKKQFFSESVDRHLAPTDSSRLTTADEMGFSEPRGPVELSNGSFKAF